MAYATTCIGPEDFRVYGHEKIQPAYATFEGKMYAGTLPAHHDIRTGMTQFLLFEPDTQLVPQTMALWMNGGPGLFVIQLRCHDGTLTRHSTAS